jgi:leucyl-tRNA synthetase
VARSVHEITGLMDRHRFNVVVARLMELTSTLRRATGGVTDPAVRDGVAALTVMLSPFAPYCAEECWALLGHDVPAGDTVSRAAWPRVEEALLAERSVTCVVQIDGRVRHRLDVPPDIAEAELRERALAVAVLDGRTPSRVIVRAPKLVNIVLE